MKIWIIFLIVSIVILLLISLILYLVLSNSIKAKLPDQSVLKQDYSFYSKNRTSTEKYLVSVYPAAEKKFKTMSDLDIAKFYNSLWFYYNCKSSFDMQVDISGYGNIQKWCWQELPDCGVKYPCLPYTPQGLIYSFISWITNSWTPWIESDSVSVDPKDISAGYPGVNLWVDYISGPGPLFMFQRTAFRNVYSKKLPSKRHVGDTLVNVPDIKSGDVHSLNLDWNYPLNWFNGQHGHVEVGFTDSLRGFAGAIVWWNCVPGSGIFVNLGKTLVSRNKSNAVFLLAEELGSSDSGKQVLQQLFGFTDPYDIVVACMMKNPRVQRLTSVWDSEKKQKIEVNMCNGADGSPNYYGIPTNGQGWASVLKIGGMDWFKYSSPTLTPSNRDWAYNIPNESIDYIMHGKTYIADRINAQGCFDEAISIMGWNLGYDTIQMVYSANGTGFWQVEIIELRNYPSEVSIRDYSQYLELKNGSVTWRTDNGVVKGIIDSTMSMLSLRDPFDKDNDDISIRCDLSFPWAPDLDWDWNATCKNNISNVYSQLSVGGLNTKASLNMCSPDGIGLAGNKVTDSNAAPYG